MSRKLATTIKDSAIPGKYKRVLEAYAAFANNDGTNIFAAQEKIAGKASTSSRTVRRLTPTFIELGVLRFAQKHTCKVKGCNGGSAHYCGYNGKWTRAYEIDLTALKATAEALTKLNDAACSAKVRKRRAYETYLTPEARVQFVLNQSGTNCPKRQGAICPKAGGANCPTDSGIKETPALGALALGKQQTPPQSPLVVSEGVSELPSLATLATASASSSKSNQDSNPHEFGSSVPSEEKATPKPNPNTEEPEEGYDPAMEQFYCYDVFTDEGYLLSCIMPKPSRAAMTEGLPVCRQIMTHFADVESEFRRYAAQFVLKYNRAHRDHKYATKDDKKFYIRTPEQFLAALESKNSTLMTNYRTHDLDDVELCIKAGVEHYSTHIEYVKEQRVVKKREAARKKEEARLAKLCDICKKVPFGKMSMPGRRDTFNHIAAKMRPVCDDCYDDRYEY